MAPVLHVKPATTAKVREAVNLKDETSIRNVRQAEILPLPINTYGVTLLLLSPQLTRQLSSKEKLSQKSSSFAHSHTAPFEADVLSSLSSHCRFLILSMSSSLHISLFIDFSYSVMQNFSHCKILKYVYFFFSKSCKKDF